MRVCCTSVSSYINNRVKKKIMTETILPKPNRAYHTRPTTADSRVYITLVKTISSSLLLPLTILKVSSRNILLHIIAFDYSLMRVDNIFLEHERKIINNKLKQFPVIGEIDDGRIKYSYNTAAVFSCMSNFRKLFDEYFLHYI